MMKYEATSANEVAHLIAKLRYERGLTQQQLGSMTGLGRTSITNIEQGRQHTSMANVFAIFDALGFAPVLTLKGKGR